MEVVALQPDHIDRLKVQSAQRPEMSLCSPEIVDSLCDGSSWSAIDGDDVLICAGTIPVWSGRAIVWALLSQTVGPRRFLTIHRLVEHGLDDVQKQGFQRIETTIDPTFPNAVRWAGVLGFRAEGLMQRYGPDGRDHLLVARVLPSD